MLLLKEVGACITVNGKDLEEYAVQLVDDRTVRCYVASEADQVFKVKIRNDLNSQLVVFRIYMDGVELTGNTCRANHSALMDGISVSSISYKPFVFANIETTDDEAMLMSGWDNLGIVELRVLRVEKWEPLAITDHSDRISTQPIHELSKKAGTHRVSLGEEILSKDRYNQRSKYLDPKSNPFVRFQFFYRPKAVLQAQGIIPPAGVPSPSVGRKRPMNDPSSSGSPSGSKRARRMLPGEDPPNSSIHVPGGSRAQNPINISMTSVKREDEDIKPDIHSLSYPQSDDDKTKVKEQLRVSIQQSQVLKQQPEKIRSRRRPSSHRVKTEQSERDHVGPSGSAKDPIIID